MPAKIFTEMPDVMELESIAPKVIFARLDLRLGEAGLRNVILDLQAGRVIDMDRRHPVGVGIKIIDIVRVVMDHARAAGIEHSQALCSTVNRTALTENDLSFHTAGERNGRITKLIPESSGIHQGTPSHFRGQGCAGVLPAVPKSDQTFKETSLRARANSRYPGHHGGAADRFRSRTAVAGRGRHEHTGIRRKQERDFIGAGQCCATTDGVVDHIHAVRNSLIDSCCQVRGVSA